MPAGNPRIAVLAQGDPEDPRVWSGSPAGLCSGLRGAGAVPVPIDVRAPGTAKVLGRLGVGWEWEPANPVMAALSEVAGRSRLRRAGPIDGVVTIGSGYDLRSAAPAVTFDDMTFAQGTRQPWSPVSELGPRQTKRWFERQRRIFERRTACCVGSEWTASSVRDDYGIDPAKVHIVGFGRNLETSPAERDWSVPHFIFIGVEWERKRGPAVLAAFERIRKRHPGATLDVIGEHPPLDQAGVRGHGRLSLASDRDRAELVSLLSKATCLALPSAFEAFGIAYLDAGAAGVPSIGTTVGGAPDAVGEGGVLVDPDDQSGLLDAMELLCDPDRARQLGERAATHAEQLTWRKVAERILRALGAVPAAGAEGLAEYLTPAAFYSSSSRSLPSAR